MPRSAFWKSVLFVCSITAAMVLPSRLLKAEAPALSSASNEPWRLLLKLDSETLEEYAARVGKLPDLHLGSAKFLSGRYDQESKGMPVEIRIDAWAKEHAFGGPYLLTLDEKQADALSDPEAELPVEGHFELMDGRPQCVSITVVTSVGFFSPVLDLSDPWALFQVDDGMSPEEFTLRIRSLPPLLLGSVQPKFKYYDPIALSLPVDLRLDPWASKFAPKIRYYLKLSPTEVQTLADRASEFALMGSFNIENNHASCATLMVVTPMGNLIPEAVPPPLADVSLNAQGLWETPIRVGEGSIPLVQILAETFARETNLVTLSQDYWIGKFPVTQRLYQVVMDRNPSHFKDVGWEAPVEQVSWNEAQDFIARLNGIQQTFTFRLPTEAEWEYACRAGTELSVYGPLNAIAWHQGNSGGATHPVGQKQPNDYGLHDMLGNVSQWCQDWYADYPKGSLMDPQGPVRGICRVFRGGSWNSSPKSIHADARLYYTPNRRFDNVGFRLAASLRTP